MISNGTIWSSRTLPFYKNVPLVNNMNSNFLLGNSLAKPFKARLHLKVHKPRLEIASCGSKRKKELNRNQEKAYITIDNIDVEEYLGEHEIVFPSQEFSQQAHIPTTQKYLDMYKKSIEEPSEFWSEIASSEFYWTKQWNHHQPFSHNLHISQGNINIQWFKGGITNICYNCIDRNIEGGLGDKIAMYWEGNEPAFDASLTYTHLLHQVSQ
ncbi:Acetyl-coenzyme A synthetase, chloroplastic/glyoxysomal, partial [Cucurbita argyrosperma subsp. sororia]